MRALSCMIMSLAAFVACASAQSNAGVKAFDIGKNGADKTAASVRFPTVDGGYVMRTAEMSGIAFFGERLAESVIAFRIPVAKLVGHDPRIDARVSNAVHLDAKADPAICFESSSVSAVTVKDQDGMYRIRGKLTLLGKTKDVVFEGQIVALSIPGGRERGFIGDGLNMKMSAILDPADFGVDVPAPAKGAGSQQMNVSFNVFALTNDKPTREKKSAIDEVLHPKPAESRPAKDDAEKRAPESRPKEKN